MRQITNSINSWDLEDLPSKKDVEFYLSEDTEQPFSTDHIFYDEVTDESMIEIFAIENIEKSFETCLVHI